MTDIHKKQRIEYIDIAKGICIILVVYAHIDTTILDYKIGIFFDSFRMPLYFFLSGLFFKQYSGIFEFTIKKINNLIVPLFFFFIFSYLFDFIWAAINTLHGNNMLNNFKWQFWDPIRFGGGGSHNPPLWFLTCLFEINIIYYILHKFLNFTLLNISIIIISVIGWYLAANGIVLPYKGTSALVSLPFFHIGYLIRKSGFLTENKHRDKYLFASIIPISVFVYYIAQPVNIAGLHLPDHYWIFYTAGIGGTLSILFLSKWIKHLPGIAYFGRYSLITFGTHWAIFTTAGALLYPLISESFTSYLLILLIVLACEMVLIPIGIKYFPRFTAQQELIPSDLLNKEKIKKQ